MAKAYRGVLKARINKLYGGDVTTMATKSLGIRFIVSKQFSL